MEEDIGKRKEKRKKDRKAENEKHRGKNLEEEE